MKKITHKSIIILVLSLSILVFGVNTIIYAYNKHNYNKYSNEASIFLDAENFDEAILSFNTALEYDDSSLDEINTQIELTEQLKTSKIFYEEGITLLNKKDYLMAIEKFENVIENDKERYDLAREKINESRESYINEKIEKAKIEANEQRYQDAIKYLDVILVFDDSNKQAIQLKNEYNDIIKKIEEEKLQKKLEEERLKKLEQEKKSNTSTNKKVTSSAPYTIKKEGNNLKISTKEGINFYAGAKYVFNDLHPRSQVFKILAPSDCTYELTVHYEDKDVTVSGNFDDSFFVHVMSGKIPADRKLTSTFKLYSHGKVYTITKSFTVSTRLL